MDDINDTVTMKRARNTLAARKSRQRKMQRFDELEERIAELEATRDYWRQIALGHVHVTEIDQDESPDPIGTVSNGFEESNDGNLDDLKT